MQWIHWGVWFNSWGLITALSLVCYSSTVIEDLSRQFSTGCSWKLLYADDLISVAKSNAELLVKLKAWKAEMGR